jgi:hypothetical protein
MASAMMKRTVAASHRTLSNIVYLADNHEARRRVMRKAAKVWHCGHANVTKRYCASGIPLGRSQEGVST